MEGWGEEEEEEEEGEDPMVSSMDGMLVCSVRKKEAPAAGEVSSPGG